jgi:hypothetical protein
VNVVLRKPMTIDPFLVREEQQDLRYEFDGFQPVAMTGGPQRTLEAEPGDPEDPPRPITTRLLDEWPSPGVGQAKSAL